MALLNNEIDHFHSLRKPNDFINAIITHLYMGFCLIPYRYPKEFITCLSCGPNISHQYSLALSRSIDTIEWPLQALGLAQGLHQMK